MFSDSWFEASGAFPRSRWFPGLDISNDGGVKREIDAVVTLQQRHRYTRSNDEMQQAIKHNGTDTSKGLGFRNQNILRLIKRNRLTILHLQGFIQRMNYESKLLI